MNEEARRVRAREAGIGQSSRKGVIKTDKSFRGEKRKQLGEINTEAADETTVFSCSDARWD